MYIMNESRLFELQSEAQDRHDGHRFEHYLSRSKRRAELIEVTVQDMAGFFICLLSLLHKLSLKL